MFDVGDAVVILPGKAGTARKALAAVLTADRYEELLREIDDPDLQDQ